MPDYRGLGLNQFLQPINAPISASGAVSSYDFDSNYQSNIVRTTTVQDNAITDRKITSISADKIGAGTVIVSINLGTVATGYIKLDGANNNIVVNDGTVDRILMGYDAGGF